MPYLSEFPVSLANLKKAPIGSDPVLNTNTSGDTLVMSSYSVCSATLGDSTNAAPRFSCTKSVMPNTVFSSLNTENNDNG